MSIILKPDDFKDPVSKRDLLKQAQETATGIIKRGDNTLDLTVMLTRFLAFATEVKKQLKKRAVDEFSQEGLKEVSVLGANVTYVEPQKPQLDYRQDMKYASLEDALKERKMQLDAAFQAHHKHKQEHVDLDGVKIPVVKVKGYRDSYFKIDL